MLVIPLLQAGLADAAHRQGLKLCHIRVSWSYRRLTGDEVKTSLSVSGMIVSAVPAPAVDTAILVYITVVCVPAVGAVLIYFKRSFRNAAAATYVLSFRVLSLHIRILSRLE